MRILTKSFLDEKGRKQNTKINTEIKNRGPDTVTLKLMGSRGMLELVLDRLEEEFYAVRTSLLLPNSEDEGFHVFLKIVGVRE